MSVSSAARTLVLKDNAEVETHAIDLAEDAINVLEL